MRKEIIMLDAHTDAKRYQRLFLLFLALLVSAPGCQGEVTRDLSQPLASERENGPKLTPAKFAQNQADWPAFRGPGRMGIATEQNPPITWSPDENLTWKIAIPGPGASSPIVWGERVYLTCYSGYFVPGEPEGALEQLQRHLLAIRRSDGEILWSRTVPAKLPEEPRIRDHGYAASSPAADAEQVDVFPTIGRQ